MPRGLDSADRKLLIGTGIVFALLVAVSVLFAPAQSSGSAGFPSSYSPSWDGAEGAFLLLQKLDYRVSRWEHPPTDLPIDASGKVLVLADPFQSPSEEERYAISEFIQRGGRVIATGPSASGFLPEAKAFHEGDPFEQPENFHALIPSPITRGAPQITMMAPASWQPDSFRQLVVYGDEDTAAVVAYPFGRGEVIWWAGATPLTNQAIRNSGNLAFFLNCVGASRQNEVFWDEYFHGVHGSLFTFLGRTPLPWGAAQFGLILLAIFVTYSRRLGPVRAPLAQSRLSPLEFVDTLGDLYAFAHVSSAAVSIAYRRFQFVLTRKLGLALDTSPADLAKSAAESLGWDEVPLADTLKRCELASKNENISDTEAAKLVQHLHDYSALLEVRRVHAGETQTERHTE